MSSFDLVVLGTGAAGSTPASECRRAGWRVAVVDDQPYGGTCALRGCDPKKVLVGAADVVDWENRMRGSGVVGEARIDWQALIRFKCTFTDPVPPEREEALVEAGIAMYHGHARFTGEDCVRVGDEDLRSRYFVIATGASPRPLGIAGEEHVKTSTDFLALGSLPSRVAFIGAGYISFEFAHIARRAGANVTILGRGAPLRQFDQDAVHALVEHSRRLGIDVRTDVTVTGVEKTNGSYRVHGHSDTTEALTDADLVVHGAGRIPNTRDLGAAAGGIDVDEHAGIRVSEHLQSVSNPRVYAAGDAAVPPGALPLTPVASYEGKIVAENLLHGNAKTADYRGIPSVVYTIPPLASVGLTEAEAKRRKVKVRVNRGDTGSWYSQRRVRERTGMFKTIVDEATDRLLGAHVLGHAADEVINIFALAIRNDIAASALKEMIYSYPTHASDTLYML